MTPINMVRTPCLTVQYISYPVCRLQCLGFSFSSKTGIIHVSKNKATCVFAFPAGQLRSSHVCSLFLQVRGDEAYMVHSSSPMRCEHAGDRCSCAPVRKYDTIIKMKVQVEGLGQKNELKF